MASGQQGQQGTDHGFKISVLHQWIPAFAGMTRLSLCFGFRRDDAHPRHKTSGAVHINNVNAYDSRLVGWMNRFKGVATKNLRTILDGLDISMWRKELMLACFSKPHWPQARKRPSAAPPGVDFRIAESSLQRLDIFGRHPLCSIEASPMRYYRRHSFDNGLGVVTAQPKHAGSAHGVSER